MSAEPDQIGFLWAIFVSREEKEQTMLDAIDRGCLEGGYLDDEDLRIIFERLLGSGASGLDYS